MLISLILIILPATPSIPLIPAFHTTPMPTRQTPLTARSQHLSKHLSKHLSQHLPKHLRSPCLTAIPYRFAMASMASVKELFSTSILRNSFVAFLQ